MRPGEVGAELETLLLGGHPSALPALAELASPVFHVHKMVTQRNVDDIEGAAGMGEENGEAALAREQMGRSLPPVLIIHGWALAQSGPVGHCSAKPGSRLQPAAKPENLNMSLMLAGERDEEVGLEHSTSLLRALAQVGLAARSPFLLL